MPRRRKLSRPLGKRRYRNFFILAVEGTKTEPQYFDIFNDPHSLIKVKCLKRSLGSSAAPPRLLRKMEDHLKNQGLTESDEAWLVVDKDEWTDKQLEQLHQWSLKAANHQLALSHPKFEFWLLLHFEDGNGVNSSQDCSRRLKQHLPNYDKGIDKSKITRAIIADAIKRARQRDTPPCDYWPRSTGTTVYRLVENILQSNRRQ